MKFKEILGLNLTQETKKRFKFIKNTFKKKETRNLAQANTIVVINGLFIDKIPDFISMEPIEMINQIFNSELESLEDDNLLSVSSKLKYEEIAKDRIWNRTRIQLLKKYYENLKKKEEHEKSVFVEVGKNFSKR